MTLREPGRARQPKRRPGAGQAALLALALVLPQTARAAVTARDIDVASRVLGFLSPPLADPVKIGIVYDPANPASAQDEQLLAASLGNDVTATGARLVPVPVPLADLARAEVNVLFLTSGLGAAAAKVGAVAVAKQELCITTDIAATQAGHCAVAVQGDPKVQIVVNKAAARASGISFSSAFMLMVTQI